MNVQDLAAEAAHVFVLPEAVTRLKECMDDQASSIDDVAEVISFDPGLTTQLLKVANSALYRFPNKIETISKALQVVGTRSAYDLALAYGVTHAFSDIEAKNIDLDKFWEQSVSCGLLAKYFAEYKRIREPERLFVAGLLHDIGELVVLAKSPDLVSRCQEFNTRVSPAELQHAVLGFTYSELSALLIEKWGIPASIYNPIAGLHKDNTSGEMDNTIMQLSYLLALDNVHPDIYPGYSNLDESLHQVLDLSRNDLEDALDVTNLQCISVIGLFNPSSFVLY